MKVKIFIYLSLCAHIHVLSYVSMCKYACVGQSLFNFFFLLLSDDNHRTCCLSGKKMYNSGKIFDGRKITSIIKY